MPYLEYHLTQHKPLLRQPEYNPSLSMRLPSLAIGPVDKEKPHLS